MEFRHQIIDFGSNTHWISFLIDRMWKYVESNFLSKNQNYTFLAIFKAYFTQNPNTKKSISDFFAFLRSMYIVWVRKPFWNGFRTQTKYLWRFKSKKSTFWFFTLGFCVKYALKMGKKWSKNANFQFWINRPIRPIFIIRNFRESIFGVFSYLWRFFFSNSPPLFLAFLTKLQIDIKSQLEVPATFPERFWKAEGPYFS